MDTPARPPYERVILICCNERAPGEDACANRGAVELHKTLKEHVKAKGLQARIRVTRSLCLGLCKIGPNVCVMPENVWYHGVTAADLTALIEKHADSLELG